MANTFVAIATTTVGSGGATNIEFTNIPGTYTDLLLKVSARDNRTNEYNFLEISFNGSASTYNQRDVGGNGSIAYSSANDLGANKPYIFTNAASSTASTFSNGEIYIPNYTSSNAKSFSIDGVTENNATAARAVMSAGSWSGTSAITSIKLLTYSGGSQTLQQYTTATLYGIKNTV
jgi:hypothetical protein